MTGKIHATQEEYTVLTEALWALIQKDRRFLDAEENPHNFPRIERRISAAVALRDYVIDNTVFEDVHHV